LATITPSEATVTPLGEASATPAALVRISEVVLPPVQGNLPLLPVLTRSPATVNCCPIQAAE
jgi:hypothetical protein